MARIGTRSTRKNISFMVDIVLNEDELEERLSVPSERDVAAASQLEGDVMILGAGGKMGPSLAVRVARAIQKAGLKHRVFAVVRKERGGTFGRFSESVEVIEADLLDPKSFDTLPDAPNVVFMVGRKFGSVGRSTAYLGHECLDSGIGGAEIPSFQDSCVFNRKRLPVCFRGWLGCPRANNRRSYG